MADFTMLSGEGVVGNSGLIVGGYAAVRNAATGNDANTTNVFLTVQGDRLNAGTYYIYRAFLPSDTSSIGSGSTVTAADLHIFLLDNTTYSTTVNHSIVTTSQASTTSLATSDFGSVGGSSLGDFAVLTTDPIGTEYTVSISSPNSNISKTGNTLLGVREKDHDLANVAPTNDNPVNFYSTENANAGRRPFYRITWTTASGAVRQSDFLLMGV